MKKHKIDKEFVPGKGFTQEDWDDVDSPFATDEQLAQARPFAEVFPEWAEEIRRNKGRPKLESPKKAVSLRLDQDVIDGFKAAGEGWQARMNAALRAHLGLR